MPGNNAPPLYSCTHPQALTSNDIPSPEATACGDNPTLYCHSYPWLSQAQGPFPQSTSAQKSKSLLVLIAKKAPETKGFGLKSQPPEDQLLEDLEQVA